MRRKNEQTVSAEITAMLIILAIICVGWLYTKANMGG